MKVSSNIINVILHPIVLTIPGIFLLTLTSTQSIETAFYWSFLSLIFSGLISLFVVAGVRIGIFNNLDVSNRKQRVVLYPVAILVILLFAYFVHSQNGPVALTYASILFVIALLILDLVNSRIKASIHVAAVSALVTGVIYQYQGISYLLIVLIPLIAWARILQKRHTLKETIVGGVLGVSLTIASIFIVQFIN